MEGMNMLKTLVRNGVKCSYVLINAVSYIMKEVSIYAVCNTYYYSTLCMLSDAKATYILHNDVAEDITNSKQCLLRRLNTKQCIT